MSFRPARSCSHLCRQPDRWSWKTGDPGNHSDDHGNLLRWSGSHLRWSWQPPQMILEASSDDPWRPPLVTIQLDSLKNPHQKSWSPCSYLVDSFGDPTDRNKSAKVFGELRIIRDIRHRFDFAVNGVVMPRRLLRHLCRHHKENVTQKIAGKYL